MPLIACQVKPFWVTPDLSMSKVLSHRSPI